MRTVIFYSSKGGCSRECAEILKKHMGDKDVTLADIAHDTPGISDFDLVVVGGGVRFGKFYPAMTSFLQKHADEICEKPHILFLCCGFMELAEGYMEKLFPAKLYESALFVEYFGGELKPEKHKGIMKFVVRWIRNSIADREDDNDLPDIIESNISLLATKILAMKKELDKQQ